MSFGTKRILSKCIKNKNCSGNFEIKAFQLNFKCKRKINNRNIFDKLYSSTVHPYEGYIQRVRSTKKWKRLTEIEDVRRMKEMKRGRIRQDSWLI